MRNRTSASYDSNGNPQVEPPRRLKVSSPRTIWKVDATIESIDPFQVSLPDGRGANAIVDALLMVRQSGDIFLEELELVVGARLKIECLRGGVHVGLPEAYPVSPGSASKTGYRLVATSREDIVDHWNVEVKKKAKIDLAQAEVRTIRIDIDELN